MSNKAGNFSTKGQPRGQVRTLRVTAHESDEQPFATAPRVSLNRVRTKQVFISGLNPSHKAAELFQYLKSNSISPLRICKIKPKFDSYSSFIVEVSEIDYEKLFVNRLWQKDTLIKDFIGRNQPPTLEQYPSQP